MVELNETYNEQSPTPSEKPDNVDNQEYDKDSSVKKAEQYAGTADSDTSGKGEVVRASTSKVALRGLKVVGKIDLPQVRQKSKDSEKPASTVKKDKVARPSKSRYRSVRKRANTPAPRTVKNKSDSKDPQRAKKEKRKQHYYEKINNYHQPIKQLKKQDDADYEVYNVEEDRQPKNWFSRFIHWLTA